MKKYIYESTRLAYHEIGGLLNLKKKQRKSASTAPLGAAPCVVPNGALLALVASRKSKKTPISRSTFFQVHLFLSVCSTYNEFTIITKLVSILSNVTCNVAFLKLCLLVVRMVLPRFTLFFIIKIRFQAEKCIKRAYARVVFFAGVYMPMLKQP